MGSETNPNKEANVAYGITNTAINAKTVAKAGYLTG